MHTPLVQQLPAYRPAAAPVFARRVDARWHTGRVQRVVAYLKEHMAEPVTLNELADVACCSPWHLDRIFGEVTGLTPIAFLTAVRLEAARTRVITSRARIIEIAYDVGYNSLGSFGKRFTALVGMAPRLLRRHADHFDLARFSALLEHASARPLSSDLQRPASVRGSLCLPSEDVARRGFAFVALFSEFVPGAYPAACMVARVPGPFALRPVPDGCYSLLALAFPEGLTADQALLQNRSPRLRHAPLHLRADATLDLGELVLAPPKPEDPPIVPVFPLLLEQRA